MSSTLPGRIEAFIRDPARGRFDELAEEAFAYQHERIPTYRELCGRQGIWPGRAASWERAPMIPALAFRTVALAAAPPRETFRSSGTTGTSRSVHHHPFPDLYRAAVDASFPGACLVHLPRPAAMLSLIPSRRQAPDSSLAFMAEHVLATWGAPESTVAFGGRGVEPAAARSWLAARQREGRPALILATSLALADLLDALDRYDLRFRMPTGSTLFDTGGTKGRRREVIRTQLLARVEDRLGIPPAAVVREYGMTELTSQCYTRVLAGGDPETFFPPHWVRVRILDAVSLTELPAGETGLVALFDLANVGSVAHLLTADLGTAIAAGREPGERGEAGFRLLGRAAGAELRGCSLLAEEIAGSPA